MRDLFLLAITLAYLVIGFRAPFVFGLGYIWTDYFDPQLVAYSFMRHTPVSLIMALAALGGFLVAPKQDMPRLAPGIWLLILLAGWITLTTTWAEVPSSAWATWNWSFKTVCFAAFLPYLFRTRTQLESLLTTMALAAGGTLLAFGAKTALGGTHYGATIALVGGNVAIAEQGTLSCIAVTLIPIFVYLHRYGTIIRSRWLSFALFYGLSGAALMTTIGTVERTGLVALAVLGILSWWNAKRKALVAVVFAVIASVSGYFLSSAWIARMSTIEHHENNLSAMVRLTVWRWDMDYAASHPLGGGFNVYEINHISIPLGDSGRVVEQTSRAAHSIYFQLLSEQGFPGLIIFAVIIAVFFANAHGIHRRTKNNEQMRWANELSRTIVTSSIIYLCGGAFQSIAFQPFLYDIIAVGVILNNCVARMLAEQGMHTEYLNTMSPVVS